MISTPIPGTWRPRPFALVVDAAGSESAIVAWGMTLPDGSAVAVDWRHGPSSAVAVCANADRTAGLFGADIAWLTLDPDTMKAPPRSP